MATNKTEIEKLNLNSMDIVHEKQSELLRMFPESRTEKGKIDFDKLKLALGEMIDSGKERYGMNWPGKAECYKTIQTPSIGTLLPVTEKNPHTTNNVIIEGDNLEVLKLLQKAYLGKIKLIYIDPPYNTGKEFIYPDNFSESLQTYLEFTGQVDSEGKKFGTNVDTDGRFHSKWLNMMFPRLYLARNLLADDGAIFISIDDNEQANLRMLCNEIFGEENFISNVIWEKKFSPQNDDKYIAPSHDHILVYAKNKPMWRPNLLKRDEEALKKFKNLDNDPRGDWSSGDLTSKTKAKGHSYEIVSPTGKKFLPPSGRQWAPALSTFQELLKDNRIWFGEDGNNMPRQKQFLSEVQSGIVPMSIWKHEDVGHNQEAKQELKEIFGEDVGFETPKPSRLIQKIIEIGTDKDSIILDFFAGSGTTGEAVIRSNIEDGGSRQYFLVQLPEETTNVKFKSIFSIAEKRLESVISGIENKDDKIKSAFAVFRLSESNFKAWNQDSGTKENLEKQLDLHVDHVKQDRSAEDILYEILLKSGFPLTTKVEVQKIGKQKIYSVAGGMLLVCLENNLGLELIKQIADQKPERVICLDQGFANNDQLKANAVQIFKTKGIASFKTV